MALSQVSVVLIEPVGVFEFGVGIEVFGIDRRDDGVPKFDLRVCAEQPDVPLRTNVPQVSLTATSGLSGVVGSDLVVVPATGIRPPDSYPRPVLSALRDAANAGATLLSLCSGSFVLGAAGLLDDRACTTHWKHVADMQTDYPRAQLDPRVLYVDDGNIVTSAGTAAGIDACLHVVRRELGNAVATKIARLMVVPPQRDGGQQQFVETPIPDRSDYRLAPLLEWLVEHLDHNHSVDSMAKRSTMSGRTFVRRFHDEVGTTPHKWLSQQRVMAARSLLEKTDLGIDQISARVGFNSSVVLREHFRQETGLAPGEYRRRFGAQRPAQA